jgi:hypothetical protein
LFLPLQPFFTHPSRTRDVVDHRVHKLGSAIQVAFTTSRGSGALASQSGYPHIHRIATNAMKQYVNHHIIYCQIASYGVMVGFDGQPAWAAQP